MQHDECRLLARDRGTEANAQVAVIIALRMQDAGSLCWQSLGETSSLRFFTCGAWSNTALKYVANDLPRAAIRRFVFPRGWLFDGERQRTPALLRGDCKQPVVDEIG